MAEYTPTTDAVKTNYVLCMKANNTPHDPYATFDRWLAAHDAEVRKDEREKVATELATYPSASNHVLHISTAIRIAREGFVPKVDRQNMTFPEEATQ